MTTLIVIPARYASTRLPAKPLIKIAGISMLQRVAAIARRAAEKTNSEFVIATDHDDIIAHCRDIGAPAIKTSPDLRSGSDRTLKAAEGIKAQPRFVVNLQGDAPFTETDHVVSVIREGAKGAADVVTPVLRLDWEALDRLRMQKSETPFSGTTCLRDNKGIAYWFSKQIVPAIRNEERLRQEKSVSPVFRHIGLYGYQFSALKRFSTLKAGCYESLEGLEQLRFLENGMTIQTVEVDRPSISMSGIDSPQDVSRAEALISEFGDPFKEG